RNRSSDPASGCRRPRPVARRRPRRAVRASALNLVAFDVWLSRAAEETLHSGQALTLFTIAIAAAEIGIGLAIVLAVHRNRGTSDIDKLRDTAEGHEPDGPDTDTPATGTAAEKAEATA
ncbi:NADH-quinone oxidoreductase subunit K, partial [Streptomyces violaceoruber]